MADPMPLSVRRRPSHANFYPTPSSTLLHPAPSCPPPSPSLPVPVCRLALVATPHTCRIFTGTGTGSGTGTGGRQRRHRHRRQRPAGGSVVRRCPCRVLLASVGPLPPPPPPPPPPLPPLSLLIVCYHGVQLVQNRWRVLPRICPQMWPQEPLRMDATCHHRSSPSFCS